MSDIFLDAVEFSHGVDTAVLLALNGLHTPALDAVMHTLSMRSIWIPFYLFLFFLVWKRRGWKSAVVCCLTVAAAVAVADQLCGSVLRGMAGRMRPSNPDNPISLWIHIVNNHRGGRYGFPSCHAANTAAVATILSVWLRNRNISVMMFVWAAVISVSRVFLGVHYPGDVLAGFIIGMLIAMGCLRIIHMGLPRVRRTWPGLGLPVSL